MTSDAGSCADLLRGVRSVSVMLVPTHICREVWPVVQVPVCQWCWFQCTCVEVWSVMLVPRPICRAVWSMTWWFLCTFVERCVRLISDAGSYAHLVQRYDQWNCSVHICIDLWSVMLVPKHIYGEVWSIMLYLMHICGEVWSVLLVPMHSHRMVWSQIEVCS